MEGRSLQPVFKGASQDDRYLFWEHEGHCAVRDGDWKLVKLNDKPWELYDMSKDRTELNNLVEKSPEIAGRLMVVWAEWADRANVLPPAEVRRLKKELSRARNQKRKEEEKRLKVPKK